MGIVENCSSGHGELLLAIGATENGFAALNANNFFASTLRANDAIGPAERLKVLPALDFAVKTRHKSRKVNAAIRKVGRHNQAPMKRKKKTDREVLNELFPREIVQEVDAILDEADRGSTAQRKNPPDGTDGPKPLKPWGRKWVEKQKRRSE
jgi:hypothetical protein